MPLGFEHFIFKILPGFSRFNSYNVSAIYTEIDEIIIHFGFYMQCVQPGLVM